MAPISRFWHSAPVHDPTERDGRPSNFYKLVDCSHGIRLKPRRQWRNAFECLILAAAVIMFLVTMIVLAEFVGIT